MSSLVLWPIALLVGLCGGWPVTAQQLPQSSFSCDGRTSGYYADVSTGCQVYHMCDGLGRQFSYSCPSKTLFQQRMLICDHWYMVNCSKAEEDYSANLLIGQPGRAFVEDRQFHRTPRPDLTHPQTSDVHIFKAQQITTRNVVGAETSAASATDETEYNPPSHWSLDISATTPVPSKILESGSAAVPVLVKQSYYRTNYGNKVVDPHQTNKVNFPSSFKATTPVYPEHLDIDLSKFQDLATNESPLEEDTVNFPSKFRATTPVYPKHVNQDASRASEFDVPAAIVNFPSHFQATTPVYPTHVTFDPLKLSEFDFPPDDNTPLDLTPVHFASKFKATTPVYPKTVNADLSKFSGSEEQPPDQQVRSDVVVNFASKFQATTPVYPAHVDLDMSKFQEPVELPLDNSVVNFGSNFQATTPVYPDSVASTSPLPDEVGLLPPKRNGTVNFASQFPATTPVYPRSVAATSPDPSKVGLLAPQLTDVSSLEPSADVQPPSFDSTFKRRSDEEEPSVLGSTFSGQQLTEFMLTIKPEQLKDLKQLWHIPDYEFPLETATRPGYEGAISSFQERGKLSAKTR